jgi:hypothetical protein
MINTKNLKWKTIQDRWGYSSVRCARDDGYNEIIRKEVSLNRKLTKYTVKSRLDLEGNDIEGAIEQLKLVGSNYENIYSTTIERDYDEYSEIYVEIVYIKEATEKEIKKLNSILEKEKEIRRKTLEKERKQYLKLKEKFENDK